MCLTIFSNTQRLIVTASASQPFVTSILNNTSTSAKPDAMRTKTNSTSQMPRNIRDQRYTISKNEPNPVGSSRTVSASAGREGKS